MKLLTRNAKMRLTGPGFYDFGMLSDASSCPWAGECFSVCYAHDGHYQRHGVRSAMAKRLELTKSPNFTERIILEIMDHKRSIRHVRIHSSGDFYSPKYLDKWLAVMRGYPDIGFYAYTKAVPLFKKYKALGLMPKNFTWVYSFGGKSDALIDTNSDRHSRVFAREADIPAGYTNASHTDRPASEPHILRIGLAYHGRFKTNRPTLGV